MTKNFATTGCVEKKKYAKMVFLGRTRSVLCSNVNNSQKKNCCGLLFTVVTKTSS